MTEKPPPQLKIDAVFDIETEDWDKFLCGGILYADGRYLDFWYNDEKKFVDTILNSTGQIWAHNGGRFDALWLLEHIRNRGISATITPRGSTALKIDVGKTLSIRDSYAAFPLSLAEFTAGLGVSKSDTGFECECGKKCGGYCKFKRSMNATDKQRVLDYLKLDCESLINAMRAADEFATTNGLDLTATPGSGAWKNVKKILSLPDSPFAGSKSTPQKWTEYNFARDAYFGGRVTLTREHATDLHEYDVNSMYPHAISSKPLPHGDFETNIGRTATQNFENKQPGIYRAVVNVPESFLPPLPVRAFDRITYPTGKFSGTWTLPELLHAKSSGTSIESIQMSLTWESERVFFNDWVKKMFDLRANAPGGKKSPLGTFVKLYLNSLTGKFASNPAKETLYINYPGETKICELDYWKCKLSGNCTNLCGAHYPFAPGIRGATHERIDPCGFVHWAAYLTSYARIEWHKQASHFGNDLIYGDTDSIFVRNKRTNNVGDELGQWQYQGHIKTFHGIAPKIYTCERGDKIIYKAKGISLPRASEQQKLAWDAMLRGERIPAAGVNTLKTALRNGNLFAKKTLSRQIGCGFGDRIIDGDSTRPPTIEEVKTIWGLD